MKHAKNFGIKMFLAALGVTGVAHADFDNTGLVWVCHDSEIVHATCHTEWTNAPASFLGYRDLRFDCSLWRNTQKQAEYKVVVEVVEPSGEQDSPLIDVDLTGFIANYCVKNRSTIKAGSNILSDGYQKCRPWSTGGDEGDEL